MLRRRASYAALLAPFLVVAACEDTEVNASRPGGAAGSTAAAGGSTSGGAGAGPGGSTSPGGAAGAMAGGSAGAGGGEEPVDMTPGNATFKTQRSVEQVFVTHAPPDALLELRDRDGAVVSMAAADHLGSHVFRKVKAGKGYRVHRPDAGERSDALEVLDEASSKVAQSFYADQKLDKGTGYITTRDGTRLSVFVTLPGPADKGPYPTVVNYSGYDPSRPGEPIVGEDQKSLCKSIPVLCDAPSDASALLAAVSGYATVSVNMRGTGCSGGAYDYFERLQLLDGYDIVETVAAQNWVKHHKVGMVGLSFPGISQLFVARVNPPSLAAIAPMSVIGNTVTTLYPGAMLNMGFALEWITNVFDRAAPYGQGWEKPKIEAGDTLCEENQLLHDQRVNVIEEAKMRTTYDAERVEPINPTGFAGDIKVPVFMVGSYQDEQTGPYFVTLLDKFKNAKSRHFVVYNGVHPDGFAPQVLAEWKAFLDIYVAQEAPSIPVELNAVAPEVATQISGKPSGIPTTKWTGFDTVDEARAAWESGPSVRAIFENGGGTKKGSLDGTFEMLFTQWPPAEVAPKRYYFQPDGSLADTPPSADKGASSFELDPTAGERGILKSGGVWDALPDYDWREPAEGKVASFITPELTDDVVMVGTGSVDLYVRAPVDDADLEVNLTEVRPDGQEMYVQSGWLRASYRKPWPDSPELMPLPTMKAEDVQPLVPGEMTLARVAIAGFGHVFRKGSRIRISVDTPGDSRAAWRFDLKKFDGTVRYDIGHAKAYASSVLLPVVAGAKSQTPLPACPSLRGQPCRPYAATPNVVSE